MTLDRRSGAPARISLALLLVGLLLAVTAGRATAETYMTVSDVPIDVTAKNAAAARDKAIADVQSKAFARLIKRLVPNQADQARLRPSQGEVESFVQDFAIQNERASPVRYIARFSVRFRAGKVRQYLADAGIQSIGELQQVLLVPVYKGPNGLVLWGQANIWRAAWDQGGFGDEPVTLLLPNGDRYDTGTLSAAAAESGDIGALVPLIQRYHTAGIVVVEAAPRDPGRGAASGLTLTMATFDMTGPKGTQTMTLDAEGGEPSDKVLRHAVAEVAKALETGWQQAIAGNGSIGLARQSPGADQAATGQLGSPDFPAASGPGTLYPIALSINDIGDWVKARDQLATMPGVQRLSLDALTRNSAAFTLDFAGDPLALQTILAGSGFVLVQTAPANAAGPGSFALKRVEPVAAMPGPP